MSWSGRVSFRGKLQVKSVLHSTKIKIGIHKLHSAPLFVSTQLAKTLVTRRIYSLRASIVDVLIETSNLRGGRTSARLKRARFGEKRGKVHRIVLID
jgi:hypothetical protein